MTEMTTTLRELLDAAYEASSVDATIEDKMRLSTAINEFEISEAIPCSLCKSVDCDRQIDNDGNPFCLPIEEETTNEDA